MDYLFNEMQLMVQEIARKIAVEKIFPVAAEYDESGEFPWDIIKLPLRSFPKHAVVLRSATLPVR